MAILVSWEVVLGIAHEVKEALALAPAVLPNLYAAIDRSDMCAGEGGLWTVPREQKHTIMNRVRRRKGKTRHVNAGLINLNNPV